MDPIIDQPSFEYFSELPPEIQNEILRYEQPGTRSLVKHNLKGLIYNDLALNECSQPINDSEYEHYLNEVNPEIVCKIYHISYDDKNEYLYITFDKYFGVIINRHTDSHKLFEYTIQTVEDDSNPQFDSYFNSYDQDKDENIDYSLIETHGFMWEEQLKDSVIYSGEYGLITTYRILNRRLSCMTNPSYSPKNIILEYLQMIYDLYDRYRLLVFLRINALEMGIISTEDALFSDYDLYKSDDKTLERIDDENHDLYKKIKEYIEALPNRL